MPPLASHGRICLPTVPDAIGAAPFLNGFKSRVFGIGPPTRLSVPDRRQGGISELQGLQGICLGKPTGRMERLVDLRHLECRTDIDGYANETFDFEIGAEAIDFRSGSNGPNRSRGKAPPPTARSGER